jgi:Zn-finger nucleic acid-binding protein
MKCPADQTPLVRETRHGVEVEFCPSCKGVWLERGELDKIIEAATPPVVLKDPSPETEAAVGTRGPDHTRGAEFGGAKSRARDSSDKTRAKGRRYGGRFSPSEFKDFLEDIFDFD